MNNICPQCHKPAITAELHAYGKCEDCYNPSPLALSSFPSGIPISDQQGQNTHHRPCGGGHRVIKTTRGLS